MLHLRNESTVLASLVFIPECGPNGTWVQAHGDQVKCGPDDPRLPALQALQKLPPIDPARRPDSKQIYLIGFQARDRERAERVTAAGLEGVPPDDMPGSVYPLLATGEFGGSLIHSPNIYDFPVSLQIARAFGGDSVWVHNGEPVHFREMWMDDRADMLRLPGIVATAVDRGTLETLIEIARDWSQVRYEA
jgi:3'(2'), 5'-bisphosphate nucleotidase